MTFAYWQASTSLRRLINVINVIDQWWTIRLRNIYNTYRIGIILLNLFRLVVEEYMLSLHNEAPLDIEKS